MTNSTQVVSIIESQLIETLDLWGIGREEEKRMERNNLALQGEREKREREKKVLRRYSEKEVRKVLE